MMVKKGVNHVADSEPYDDGANEPHAVYAAIYAI